MVEDALCLTGHYNEALVRMKSRYQSQVGRTNMTTLYENFPKGGTYNHAWNAPNTILSKHIAGIAPDAVGWSRYHIFPNMSHLTSIKQVIPSVKGRISVAIHRGESHYTTHLISPDGTRAVVGIPKASVDAQVIKVNGTTVWTKGSYVGGMEGISWNGEDDKYIKFNVSPGTWSFLAR